VKEAVTVCERVVFIADDTHSVDAFRTELLGRGYRCTVIHAAGRHTPPEQLRAGFDLAVVDASFDGADPCALAGEARSLLSVPIIVLGNARRDRLTRRIACLEAGADDWLPNSVDPRLLAAYVRARLRSTGTECDRPPSEADELLKPGDLAIDLTRRGVTLNGEPRRLTRMEFDLLATLALNEGRPMASSELLEQVWGYPPACRTRTLAVHVYRLRRKLETDPTDPRLIVTVPDHGYMLCRPA
jgi:two-component system response regulator MtrA